MKNLTLIAGPCSVESEEQLISTTSALSSFGIKTIRGGLWKPRSSHGTFEGIGEQGLSWLKKIQNELGVKVTTEVAKASHVELALEAGIDIFWIGARTTTNPFQVQELAEALEGTNVPVMIKNPVCPDLALWTGAIDRLRDKGVNNITLIHRGFCTIDNSPYRNLPAWDLTLAMKKKHPDIPMLCDPSHICGNTELIYSICVQALKYGFDGLFIESHCCPDKALSDASQQLKPIELKSIIEKLNILGYKFDLNIV